MTEPTPTPPSLGERQFLYNVRVIRTRSLVTVGIVVLATALFAAWAWWQSHQFSSRLVSAHAPLTPQEAELADRLLQAVAWLQVSIQLFAATVFAIAVGITVLIVSYGRQTKALLDLIERHRTSNR